MRTGIVLDGDPPVAPTSGTVHAVHGNLVIDSRFCGPSSSGNGGWTCGALDGFTAGRCEVTLRRPPPLDTPLTVDRNGDVVVLLDDGDLVAEARRCDDELHWPPFVEPAEAAAAELRYVGHHRHNFPDCFTCGPRRAVGDGLRIFAGPVTGRPQLVAATWTPTAEFADDGTIPDPITWAALDCPSVWPYLADGTAALLGRMTADILRAPVVGEHHVVVGEGTGVEGRKRFASAAIYTSDGEPVAVSRTTWITVDPTATVTPARDASPG